MVRVGREAGAGRRVVRPVFNNRAGHRIIRWIRWVYSITTSIGVTNGGFLNFEV